MSLCFAQIHAEIDWMMELPEGIELHFQFELEQIEQELQMPYVTSIERLAIEEGREDGVLAGQIQILTQMLGDPERSLEDLLTLPLETPRTHRDDLRTRQQSRGE